MLNLSLPKIAVVHLPMEAISAPSVESAWDSDAEKGQNIWLITVSAVYLMGAITVMGGLTFSFIRMLLHMDKVPTHIIDGKKIKLSDIDMPSFSWGNIIMISRKDFEENRAILIHEMMHVRSLHSIDLMIYAVIMTIHWFNPLVWIMRTELKILHEYEADNLTINAGVDSSQYQLLLI